MSSISTNPLMKAFSFDYSSINTKESTPEQNLFDIGSDDQGDAKQGNVAAPQ